MNRRILGLALVTMCGLMVALMVGTALAEEQAKVVGTVSVTTDDDDNITAVRLTAGNIVYNITLDGNGRRLGEQMESKKVEVTGTLREQDDAKWLTVTSFKEIKEEEEEDF